MPYLNTYQAPKLATKEERPHEHTRIEDYDFNFCFTSREVGMLEGDGRDVRLEPLVPSLHAKALLDATLPYPELFRYMGPRPWQDLADVLVFLENNARSNPGTLYYVIHDKLETVPGKLAGIIGYMSSSALNLVTEIGFVCILPHAQRTHVLTHSVSLLLDNAFNLPAQSGLGLRRVQWQTQCSNLASLKAAERLGFVNETPFGLRAERVVPAGKEALHAGRAGDPHFAAGIKSRDGYMLSIAYWEWEETVRERVKALVERK